MKKAIKKIWFCTLILCIIILLTTTSRASSYLDIKDIKTQTKDTQNLIKSIYNFKINLPVDLEDKELRKGKLANEIVRLCDNDLEKAEVFKYSYEDKEYGQTLWCGGERYGEASEDYESARMAYDAIEEGQKVETTTQEELDKLENEIYDMEKSIKQMINQNVDRESILNKAKELDSKIKEYNTKYGSSINNVSRLTTTVDTWIHEYSTEGDNYQTAQDQAEQEQQQHQQSNQHGVLGTSTPSGGHTVDEVVSEAQEFINKAEENKISGANLKIASNTLYNILLTIGIFLSVAVGMYLAIKFMISSAEDKAKVKESLVPYIAGCVVIFGAFIIWKLAITLLSGIA